MTSLSLAHSLPTFGSKVFWIKANRVLASSLIVSPAVQLAIGMTFKLGLMIDLVILAAHGLLSLVLFGKPETKSRTWNLWLHLMGFKSVYMSERNRFLLTGYRIGLGVLAFGLTYWTESGFALVLCLVWLYPLLRLPISIIQHIFDAARAALRRRHMSVDTAEAWTWALLLAYFWMSIFNLVK